MVPHNAILLNWNANGIKSQRNSLMAFLNHHNIDIACITETHLSLTDKIKFPGYKILIRNKIKHQHFPIPVLQSLEATAVLINFNNRSILIVSAYQPPSRTMHIADYDTN